ncbi:unnamed protein product [Trichobilharzia szidati]|nr:unnamed protein product [Trichobilharzia szidati]
MRNKFTLRFIVICLTYYISICCILLCSNAKYIKRHGIIHKGSHKMSSYNDDDDQMLNDAPTSNGYSLLRNDIVRQHLHVWRGHSAPLLHEHLPILPRAQKGQVCRVEVEEFQPLLSMVGHLEPKKFECSFANGDVIYRHEGNPLINHDHIQVTIFFFRNNNSVVQTVDIMIDIHDPPKYMPLNTTATTATTSSDASEMNVTLEMKNNKQMQTKYNDYSMSTIPESRIQVIRELKVKNLRATSESISSEILKIRYDMNTEECRLSYVSPDYLLSRGQLTNKSDWSVLTSFGGTLTPKLGLPLTAGSAVGGVRRWPLFGQIVHFNRTMVDYIDRDCHEALLQGYRYLHRKGNSYEVDYIPIQITIWSRMNDGSKSQLITENTFLKVKISNAQKLKPPILRTFRQVNVTHIGGSLSVLPKDSISIPRDSIPGLDYLDINMTKMQGPLQAQIVNLRDPTRPVTSFRLTDLRQGLIALQLLNYAESLVKVFVITMTAVDPYFQISQPVNLRIATFLQPVVDVNPLTSTMNAPPSFQVFSLPLFSYTGAISVIQKHNIQVVGYIDESMIVYTIRQWPNNDPKDDKDDNPQSVRKSHGQLRLDGQPVYGVNFGPPHISTMSLAYMHNGDYEPTVERIPLSITVPNLMNSAKRFKRDRLLNNNITNDKEYFEGRRNNPRRFRNRHDGQRQHSLLMNKRGKQRKNKKRAVDNSPILQLELSIRIVRLYNYITNGALKSGGTFRLPTLTSICFTAEDFLTPEALKAARSDLINLAFVVKVAPSQGVLLRLPIVKNFTTFYHLHTKRGRDNNEQMNRKYFDDINSEDNDNVDIQQQEELIDKSQVGVILLSDLETGEICYLNRRYDRATDLMGIKQIGRADFPTVYMTFELQPPLPIIINERMDPNVILRVRETASYVPVTPLHLNYGIDLDIQSIDYEQYNRSIFDNYGPEHIVYTILQAPRLRRLEDLTSGDKQGQQQQQQKGNKYPYIGTHDAGRLVSLSSVTSSTHVGDMKLQAGLAVNLREAHTPCVTHFTQRQIDENDIVYVPPTQDIGYTDQDLIVRYAVSGPGGYELNNREMRIQLVAEDNQIPVVKVISPLTVHRDGELRIDSSVLSIEDLDTPEDKLFLEFKRLPKYGKIILKQPPIVQYDQRNKNSNQPQQQQQRQKQQQQQQKQKSQQTPVVKNQNLSFSLYNSGRIIYQQSGDNVKQDDFILTVTDGVQTSPPLQVSIEIKPRVLQESKGHQYVNNTILVKENTSVILTPSVFPSDITDASMITSGMSTAPQYFVIVFPTKGNLFLNNKTKVSQFTYKDILENRLTYRHGPAEIGVKVNYDFVRIWDFSAGQTFSLNFTLIPVNSQPPVLKSETLLQVKEGDKVEITPYALYASDPDTNEADIQLHVIHPPKWGHIELINKKLDESNHQDNYNTLNKEDSMSNEFDDTYSLDLDPAIDDKLTKNNNNNNILSFNMQNIRDGLIYYVNSIHDNGQECIEDIFSIKAFDGLHYSPKTIEIKIAIQPTNDEIPTVRLLKYFSVPINTKKVLTPYLFSVSDRDVPRDMLQIRFTELPIYGSLSVYWQHGEKYTITQYSNPITQSYLGMLNLLYLQNASLIKNAKSDQYASSIITMDQFTVTVSDGKHTVERQAHVLIRPENRYPPEMYIDRKTDNGNADDGIILDGQKWSRLDLVPGGLIIRDMDTSEDDLILTLLETPKYGVIQRLPRMLNSDGIVDPLDLIEEAWDIEEMKVGGDLQALAQLSVAGSIGGPKTIKLLHRGDQFTKRQISTGRIHYLYTGSYQEQYITDSCVLRLSDGQFTTNPITLRFRIRRVNGLNTGLGQSSLPYLPVGHIQHLRPLEYPELKTENMERNEREGNQMHQNDASDMEVELLNSIILTAPLNSFTFLQYKDLQLDKVRANQIKIILQSNLSTLSTCGLLAHTSNPLISIQEFTDDDVRNHRIVFYASNDCEKFLDKHFPMDFKLISPSEDYLGQISITMSITKMKHALPELENYSEITVLPYTDTIIKSDHLSFKDKDTNLNNIIYVISDESTRQFKLDGQLINVFNESLICFTQSQINLQQILFSSYSAGNSNYAIDLYIFDAGDIGQIDNLNQLCNDILHTVNRLDKQNMANPFLERMKYTTSSSSSSSTVKESQSIVTKSEPIRLKIKNRIFQNVQQNTELMINQPPKPDSIETVLPGHVGFYLTAENIYYTLNPWTKFHLLNNEQMNCKLFNKMQNHSIDEYFYQDDLNRRRLVVILLKNQKKLKQSHKRQSKLSSIDTVCQIHYEIEDNQNLNNHKKRFSMELSWTKVGFDRKVYTICPERGLLTLSVIRKGINETIQSTVTDVYVGLSSSTAIEGEDFSLHSQKLLVFEKGESKKDVLIRFHPRENSFSRQPLRFYIDLKLPTGGILDRKRRAEVVVQGIHGKCQSKSYFTPVKIGEYTMKTSNNPVKRDLSDFLYTNANEQHQSQMDKHVYLSDAQITNNNNNDKDYNEQSHDGQDYKMEKNANEADNYPVKKPISLTEWLATNDLPDSKALSASYEKYMHSNKHSIHCLEGWKYYQHRCYRLYEHQEMTWEEARNYCELQDGFLTSISDEANMKWLTETFKLHNAFWIGLHQTRPHGTWIWHNLEHVSYTKWDTGYPVKPKWRLSTDNRIKRKYRHKRQLHQHQRYQRGPKACVLVTANLNWQNRQCNRLIMGVNFICMKNPEVF